MYEVEKVELLETERVELLEREWNCWRERESVEIVWNKKNNALLVPVKERERQRERMFALVCVCLREREKGHYSNWWCLPANSITEYSSVRMFKLMIAAFSEDFPERFFSKNPQSKMIVDFFPHDGYWRKYRYLVVGRAIMVLSSGVWAWSYLVPTDLTECFPMQHILIF